MEGKRIQCIDRTLDVLETLAGRGPCGVSELAGVLKLHVATVHNILRTLTQRGYLTNDGKRYRLGPGIGFLAARSEFMAMLPEAARPHLERISSDTGESAVLTLLVGMRAEVVAWTSGMHEIMVQYPCSSVVDPLKLATSRLLVAHEPEQRQRRLIQSHLNGTTPEDGETLTQILAHIRNEQCCRIDKLGENGSVSVAVPVCRTDGSVMAAMGVNVPTFRATDEHVAYILQALKHSAGQLGKAFSGRQ